nr:HAMP domain-containing protein [Paenibacillus larvae]
MRIFLAVLLMLTLLLSFLLVIISTRYIVKPIKTLTDATKKVAEGNYHIQLNTQRKDEIGKLARHFLQMATSLKRLEDMRQEFVSNVSHEIQSPSLLSKAFPKHCVRRTCLPNNRSITYLLLKKKVPVYLF